jgi:hypothetical protein
VSHEVARRQLQQMRAKLKLDPLNKYLSVEVAFTARTLRHIDRAEQRGTLEPLPALIAQLAKGEITTNTAGSAITRDLSLAAQVAALTFGDAAQIGEVTIGDVASGSIYHIYLGGPPPNDNNR